jgi:type II secretory pathway pseudopilin PulG
MGYIHKAKMELKPFPRLVSGRSHKGAHMKKTVLMTVVLMSLSAPALAEGQTYSSSGVATNYAAQNAYQAQQAYQSQQTHQQNQYMVYPGREQYGQAYGRIPRHPGDYRDAVDRGSWSGGGEVGARSFDIR